MHAVANRIDVADEHPELPLAICKAYCQAKKKALSACTSWARPISLPWIAREIEDSYKVMGDNPWPYGIKADEEGLEALFQYSQEQSLTKKSLTIEELFHPSTLEFEE